MGKRTRGVFVLEDRAEKLKKLHAMSKEGEAHVKVGLLGGPKDRRPGEPISNVELGVVHEFGTQDGKIPERSFLRSTFDEQRPALLELIRKLVRGIYEGKITTQKALGVIGVKFAADVKKKVTEGEQIPPPNAPATLARKAAKGEAAAAPRTLIDTGRLINSVTHQVVTGKDDAE